MGLVLRQNFETSNQSWPAIRTASYSRFGMRDPVAIERTRL